MTVPKISSLNRWSKTLKRHEPRQVAQIAGKPSSEVTMIHARGTCQTYILGQRDGKIETYFVALDDTGHVINSGYQTCAEYDTDPRNSK